MQNLIRFLNLTIRSINFLIDFGNGVWSGFPLCCIWMYCTHHIKGLSIEYYPIDFGSAGYIRCAKCIDSGRQVKHIRNGRIVPLKEIGKNATYKAKVIEDFDVLDNY